MKTLQREQVLHASPARPRSATISSFLFHLRLTSRSQCIQHRYENGDIDAHHLNDENERVGRFRRLSPRNEQKVGLAKVLGQVAP
jgi:hypothetical protein